jgi:hypothetical protein
MSSLGIRPVTSQKVMPVLNRDQITLTVPGASGISPGSAPRPCRLEMTPFGIRGVSSRTVTAIRPPGRDAPLTAIGPVDR